MNPAYLAAEYFIDIISKNPTFSINYHSINFLIEQATEEVVSYLRRNDPLCIFKKFPDVFILNESTVTLTDAFLSLFAFPLSAEFRSCKYSQDATETSTVEYFKSILLRCGSCHYENLFNMLLSQNSLELANYYSGYRAVDMCQFFQKHYDTFIVSNHMVHLNRLPPTLRKTKPNDKALKKLQHATCFLLTCFDSLHYLELKQCIAFVFKNVREHLNSFTLIRQREIFQIFPETSMDELGYVSLKNFNAQITESRTDRLVTLIVCMLAFERQMHFQKIALEVYNRVSSDVNCILCDLSVSGQFHCLKAFPDLFVVLDNGYVSLLPSFTFPLCLFENSASNLKTYFSSLQLASLVAPDTNLPSASNSMSSPKPNDKSRISDDKSIKETLRVRDFSSTHDFKSNYRIANDQVSQLTGYISLNLRLKLSVIFLWASFCKPSRETILISSLYVLKDVLESFWSCSQAEQQSFVRKYCDFYEKVSIEGLTSVPSMDCISVREKALLFIVYALKEEKKKMHFGTLSGWITFSKIHLTFSSLSTTDWLKYFQEMASHITLSPEGYVTLNKSFDGMKSIILSHLNASPENLTPECETEENPNSQLGDKSPKVYAVDPKRTLSTDACAIYTVPSNIWKKMQLSLLFLQKHFNCLIPINVIETFLFALNDVESYFLHLSLSLQQAFVESFFRNIDEHSVFKITLNPSEIANNKISEEQKALLSITYLLIEKKSEHYEKLMKQLKQFGVKYSLCQGKAKQHFKFFKAMSNYFDINGNGCVSLSSAFFAVRQTLNHLGVFDPETWDKRNCKMKIKLPEKSFDIDPQKIALKKTNGSSLNPQKIASKKTNSSSVNIKDLIIDLTVSVLSVCKKIKIEALYKHLNCSVVGPVQNYFAFYSLAEKKQFFADVPEYFEVTKDDFISLKKVALLSYIPKTSLIVQDSKGRFVLNTDSEFISGSRPGSALSCCSSEVSYTSGSSASVIEIKCLKPKKEVSNQQLIRNADSGINQANRSVKTKIDCEGSVSTSKNLEKIPNGIKNPILASIVKPKKELSNQELSRYAPFSINHANGSVKTKIDSKNSVSTPKNIGKISNDLKDSTSADQVKQELVSNKKEDLKPTLPKQENYRQNTSPEPLSQASTISLSNISPLNITRTISLSSVLAQNLAKFQLPRQPRQKAAESTSRLLCDNAMNDNLSIPSTKNSTITSDHAKNVAYHHSKSEYNKDNINLVLTQNPAKFQLPRQPHQKAAGSTSRLLCDNAMNDNLRVFSTKNSTITSDHARNVAGNHSESEFSQDEVNSVQTQNPAKFQLCQKPADPVSPLLCDDAENSAAKFSKSKCDNGDNLDSYISYGLELVDYFIDELVLDSINLPNHDNCDDFSHKHKPLDCQARCAGPSCNGAKVNETFESGLQNSSSCPKVESEAVSFFYIIMSNYSDGVSADFLKKHLSQASLEVKRFISESYENDFISFFLQHEKVFYVLPESESIYLVTKE